MWGNSWSILLICSSIVQQREREREREILHLQQKSTLDFQDKRLYHLYMRSVENMLLQLILQGDSFTYHCAASRPYAAPHHVAPCCTHHHSARPNDHARHFMLLLLSLCYSYHWATFITDLHSSLICTQWLLCCTSLLSLTPCYIQVLHLTKLFNTLTKQAVTSTFSPYPLTQYAVGYGLWPSPTASKVIIQYPAITLEEQSLPISLIAAQYA